MNILLNGESRSTDCGDIASLVRELGLDSQWVVVERNLTVPEKSSWGSTPIEEGDQIEIVRFLGGG